MHQQQYLDTPEDDDFRKPVVTDFRFLDGATACGKSSAVCSHIRRFVGYRNQIIVCEKVELLEEWQTKLQANGIKCDLIAGDGAITEVNRWLNTHNDLIGTGVLLCTQAAIFALENISMKNECDVFFDELPPVRNVIAEKFHTSASVLKKHLKLGSVIAKCKTDVYQGTRRLRNQPDSLNTIESKDWGKLKYFMQGADKILTKEQKDLFNAVLNQNYDVCAKKRTFRKMGSAKLNRDDRINNGEITFVVMTNERVFTGWHSCTVISSDYELSMFKHWIGDRLGFRRHDLLHCRLNNRGQHPDSWIERTKFNYLIHPDEKSGLNSRFWLEQDRCRNGDELDKRLTRVIGHDEQVLLCTNVSRSKRKLSKQQNVTVITSKDIGVNEFSDRNTVVFDAALNERPEAESILKLLGFDLEAMRLDGIFNVAYQVASRANLRTNRAGEVVNLYFADKTTCDYVMSRFANKVGQVANVRHVGDSSFQAVNVVPILGNVEYSNRFKSRLRKRIRRFGGGKNGFLHQLGYSILETTTNGLTEGQTGGGRPRDQVTTWAAGVEGATGASLGDTSSFVNSEIDKNTYKSGSYGSNVDFLGSSDKTSKKFQKNSFFENPDICKNTYESSTYGANVDFSMVASIEHPQISDLPTLSDWFAWRGVGGQKIQKSKVRQFINGVLKNQISQPINPIIQGDRFFYANFAIFEFSADQCSKKEFIRKFNPHYSDSKNRKVSFLISSERGTIQVMVFFKSPCASWRRYSENVAFFESKLGIKLDVDQNRYYRLQAAFEGFNCKEKIHLKRHAL